MSKITVLEYEDLSIFKAYRREKAAIKYLIAALSVLVLRHYLTITHHGAETR